MLRVFDHFGRRKVGMRDEREVRKSRAWRNYGAETPGSKAKREADAEFNAEIAGEALKAVQTIVAALASPTGGRYTAVFDDSASQMGQRYERQRLIKITPKPLFDDDLRMVEACTILTGLATHEIAHTHLSDLTHAVLNDHFPGSQTARTIGNLLDDVRGDAFLRRRFPGVAFAIRPTAAYVAKVSGAADAPPMRYVQTLPVAAQLGFGINSVRYAGSFRWVGDALTREMRAAWQEWALAHSRAETGEEVLAAIVAGIALIHEPEPEPEQQPDDEPGEQEQDDEPEIEEAEPEDFGAGERDEDEDDEPEDSDEEDEDDESGSESDDADDEPEDEDDGPSEDSDPSDDEPEDDEGDSSEGDPTEDGDEGDESDEQPEDGEAGEPNDDDPTDGEGNGEGESWGATEDENDDDWDDESEDDDNLDDDGEVEDDGSEADAESDGDWDNDGDEDEGDESESDDDDGEISGPISDSEQQGGGDSVDLSEVPDYGDRIPEPEKGDEIDAPDQDAYNEDTSAVAMDLQERIEAAEKIERVTASDGFGTIKINIV